MCDRRRLPVDTSSTLINDPDTTHGTAIGLPPQTDPPEPPPQCKRIWQSHGSCPGYATSNPVCHESLVSNRRAFVCWHLNGWLGHLSQKHLAPQPIVSYYTSTLPGFWCPTILKQPSSGAIGSSRLLASPPFFVSIVDTLTETPRAFLPPTSPRLPGASRPQRCFQRTARGRS